MTEPDYDEDVMRQQEAIRRSGETNMAYRNTVQRIAYRRDFHALVVFIEDHDGATYLDMAETAVEYFDGEALDLESDDDDDGPRRMAA